VEKSGNDQAPHHVTQILKDWSEGGENASAQVMPLVYEELRRLAARKDTVGYRSAKFIRRHRIGVAVVLLVAVAIAAGLIAALRHARQARVQRDLAQRINTFLQDILGPRPEANGIDGKLVDMLNAASRRAQAELANQPEVRADVMMTLGRTYVALGEYEPAETNLRAALAASLQGNGKRHPTTATTMGWLGLTLAYRNKITEGEQISRQAVDLQRQLHPRGNEDLGVALYALGMSLIYKDEPKAAQPLLQEASELIKKHLGGTNGYYMASLVMLARAHENADDAEVAESLYRQAMDVGGRVEARYRIHLGQAQFYLALMLINKGAYPEAETLLLQSEAIYRKAMGGDANSNVGATRSHLAMLHLLEGNYAKAEDEARTALDLLRKYMGTDQPLTAGALSTLGVILTREGKATEGEPYLREALAIRTKVVRLDSFLIPYTESALGECLTAQKQYAEAEPLLTDGYTGLIWKLGEKDLRTIEARQRLAKLYDAWGKPEQALLFR